MPETIVFPPHQGLPFDYAPPTIDGFTDWEIGLPTEIEKGWTGAARITYGGASGVPVMSFQALRHASQPFIYLSFVVRLDVNFDDNDAIMIVLQPTFSAAAHSSDTRRILIRPVRNPEGAGILPSGDPGATDFNVVVPAMGGGTVNVPVRSNHPVNLQFDQWTAGGALGTWTSLGGAGAITNYEIRSRSWVLSGSDLDWSVEIKLPTTKNPVGGVGGGGANWIDLTPGGFGLYYNVFRFSTPPTAVNFALATEFFWPLGNTPISDTSPGGPFANLTDIMIPPSMMGQAQLTGTGQGVYFDGGWGSIGVLSGGSVVGTIDGTLGAVNTMIAKLRNDGTSDANGVNADFRLADFGIPGPWPAADWKEIDPHTPGQTNPTSRVSIPAGGTNQLTMNWTINAADRATYTGHGNDQCLLVLLDSDQGAIFRESSYRRNISFANLSTADRDIVVSGDGYGNPPGGASNHDMVLITSQRLMTSNYDYDGWQGTKQQGVNVASLTVPAAGSQPNPIDLIRRVQRLLNIPDSALTNPKFIQFVTAAIATGFLNDVQKMESATAFAPVYDGLMALPNNLWNMLLNNSARLKELLLYHFVPGRVTVERLIEFVKTGKGLKGYQLTLTESGEPLINGHRIIKRDVEFSGRLVQVIDGVLLPPSLQDWGVTAPWLANEIFNIWAKSAGLVYSWVSITAAYHATGDKLTLGGTIYPIYQGADSYSHVLTHVGQVQQFQYQLTGSGLIFIAPGVYRLPVPNKGQAVLRAQYTAVPAKEADGLPGCLGAILRLFGIKG